MTKSDQIIISKKYIHPENAYIIAKNLKFTNVPEIIIKSIVKEKREKYTDYENFSLAYNYASNIKFKNVPDLIVKKISKDVYESFYYAFNLYFKNVPSVILKSISKSGLRSIDYAIYANKKNIKIPYVIKTTIFNHDNLIKMYFKYVYLNFKIKDTLMPFFLLADKRFHINYKIT